jgi:hypothetical protein
MKTITSCIAPFLLSLAILNPALADEPAAKSTEPVQEKASETPKEKTPEPKKTKTHAGEATAVIKTNLGSFTVKLF